MKALAAGPLLAHLTSLDLQGNPIGDEGAEALAASPLAASWDPVMLPSSVPLKDTVPVAPEAPSRMPKPRLNVWMFGEK